MSYVLLLILVIFNYLCAVFARQKSLLKLNIELQESADLSPSRHPFNVKVSSATSF